MSWCLVTRLRCNASIRERKRINTLSVNGEQVILSISGWDRIFAFKRKVTFSRSNISRVYPRNRSVTPPLFRFPGTAIPGIITAGTFLDGETRKEFWCTRFRDNTLVIDLEHEDYSRIVCDLPKGESVDAWVEKLSA